jgi:hypothetical protein
MAHFRWMYLAGAAAAMCSSAAVAEDALHGFCSDCGANSTLSVNSDTNKQMNFGFEDSGNSSALFETDRFGSTHHEDGNDQGEDQGNGLHGKGDHGDNQGDDDQGKGNHGDDDQENSQQGKGHPGSGPPTGSKPGSAGVPEPGPAALLAAALLGFGMRQLRRRPSLSP